MTGRCLSTYVDLADEGYSSRALNRLSDMRMFPTKLPFQRDELFEIRATVVDKMSISGVQDKLSLRLERGGKLVPTSEAGEYILKPVPGTSLRLVEEAPANESLTMQLADQIFGMRVAANALIRLADGELAYITRRFDRRLDGSKIAQEDFCQLMGRTPTTHGRNYKYDSSCEQLATTLRRACPSYIVESETLFRRLLFDHLVGNGDSHLKNFSLQQTERGDYVLTPHYDLMCTLLHLPTDWRLALDLLDDDVTHGQQTHGFVTGGDFLELARRMGLRPNRAERLLEDIVSHEEDVVDLVNRSFLSDTAKSEYLHHLNEGRQMLRVHN